MTGFPMDIDSAASTPILKVAGGIPDASYLRYELTAIGYHLAERKAGFNALVIGPGGGRDLLSALIFGAARVDGVEINPIIARDVMLDRFRDYSGGVYANPRVTIHVDDGRNFVRRSKSKYDVIQASLVDTWAATAAGAYTLTENSLYTKEAFGEYFDHLTDDGVLTITRWVFDGLRLVSVAQEACAERGLNASQHLAIVRYDRVATFLLKRRPFTPADVAQLRDVSEDLGFSVLYAPGLPAAASAEDPIEMQRTGTSAADYRRLILTSDRRQFLSSYPLDESATTDDRPFFFHTTRLRDQLQVAFGRSMLFGNGLSALMTLMAISAALVVLFVIGPLLIGGERPHRGWATWLLYFGALGAGFMLLEVALLQRFVLLLGHPVYSLTVTLFSLLLGTGLGSLVSRRVAPARIHTITIRALVGIAVVACCAAVGLAQLIDAGVAWTLPTRIAFAVLLIAPVGILLGMRRRGMNEGDQRTIGARPRLLIDESHAARLQLFEHGTDVTDAQRDVVDTGPSLLDVFRDGRVARRRLEQLDGRFAHGNEMRADPLRRDILGDLHVETEGIPEKGERLIDVLNRDTDMVEYRFGGSASGGMPLLGGTRPTYPIDDFTRC